MREEYEERGINPLKIGLVGALIVVGIIAVLLQFGASFPGTGSGGSEEEAVGGRLQQYEVENKELKEKVAELEEVNKVTADGLEKQLKQKEAQLASLKRELSATDKTADSKLTWLRKEKSRLEEEREEFKRQVAAQIEELKASQESISKMETELRNARFELEQQDRNRKVLQAKLNQITEGDEAAADVMVQQLAEARQQLKRERALREKLEEELDDLREQMGMTPQ